MVEIWKDIKGYEEYYEISNMGYVRNKITNNILTGDSNNGGYKRVTLYYVTKGERFFVHRLVAEYFVDGKSDINKIVNHKDHNKENNRADNLEWCTISYNTQYTYDNTGRRPGNIRAVVLLDDDNNIIYETIAIKDMAEYLKMPTTMLSTILNGRYQYNHKLKNKLKFKDEI